MQIFHYITALIQTVKSIFKLLNIISLPETEKKIPKTETENYIITKIRKNRKKSKNLQNML